MGKSTITAVNSSFNVSEGGVATAEFMVSPGLEVDAEVSVSLSGWGATDGVDFSGFSYTLDGVNYMPVVNGLVTIPAGAKSFALSANVLADSNTAEYSEALAFVVAQTPQSSEALENSYWVSSVGNIQDTSALPPAPAAPSTITALNSGFEVVEGGYAMGRFKLDKALEGEAKIAVNVEGYSVTLGEDTAGALQYRVGNGEWSDVVDGTVALAGGTTKFDLRVKTVNDLKTESAETLNFTVAQVSGNLTNSYWVTSTGNVVDQEAVLRQGTDGYDTLTGSNTKQDIFDLTTGESLAAAGSFDIIRNFGQGDVIKLPEVINNWAISSTNGNALTGLQGSVSEAKVLAAIQQSLDGEYYQSGPGGLLKIQNGSNTYLLADTNGDGVFNTSPDGETQDTMIKLVGVNAFDLITGESIVA